MTQYERFKRDYNEAIDLIDEDIDKAVSRMEDMIVIECHMLQKCNDANERIYHENNLCLLQADLTIMKESKSEKQLRLSRIRENVKNELDSLRNRLNDIMNRKEIKISKVSIKDPIKAFAVVLALSALIYFLCMKLQENGYTHIPEQVGDLNFFESIFESIRQFCSSCGEWLNLQMIHLGFNIFEYLDCSPEIIASVVYPLLPLMAALSAYAVLDFVLSLVRSMFLRLKRTVRNQKVHSIRRKMRKLSQTAADA